MPCRQRPLAHGVLAVAIASLLTACSSTASDETDPTAQVGDDASTSSGPVDVAAGTGDAARSSDDAAGSTTDSAQITGDAAQSSAAEALSLTSADDAFTVDLPEGWTDASEVAPQEAVLAAQSGTRSFGFFNNLVITDQKSSKNLEEVVAQTAEALQSDDVEVSMLSPVKVDGETAYGYATSGEVDGLTVAREQRFVQFDGTQYVMTFSTSQGEGQSNNLANREFDSILESWTWEKS
ncbi:MAG: hypothetical protein WA962_12455 [Ornithinimicrobium sp.]